MNITPESIEAAKSIAKEQQPKIAETLGSVAGAATDITEVVVEVVSVDAVGEAVGGFFGVIGEILGAIDFG